MSTGVFHKVRFFCQHGRVPVPERYWKRPDGRLRLRYAVAGYMGFSTGFTFVLLSIFPVAGNSIAYGLNTTQTQIASLVTPPPARPPGEQVAGQTIETVQKVLSDFRDPEGQIRRSTETRALVAMAKVEEEKRPVPASQRLTIVDGDTLSGLLTRAGLTASDSSGAIKALGKHVRPSELRPGQTINVEMAAAESGYQFAKLSLVVDPIKTVEVQRSWGGFYKAIVHEKPLKRDIAASVAVIKSSLFGSAAEQGIPDNVTAEAIRAFAHQIDFQRDISPGDKFEVMYDRFVTNDGYVARTGGLVFARLHADGREIAIYRFQSNDGRVDFYDSKGQSIRKALLRTPVEAVRISSGFGMRRHPIMGYSKMHKGVDFAAGSGTPIFAAGDGTIEKAGRFGAYGNYVRIRHTGKLQTAYAHLSRYGNGIRPGVRVKQGQIIGYVGSTGRSTGPHLHYEVLVNGAQVNPQSVKLPTMVVLEGKDKKSFQDLTRRIDQEFRNRASGVRVASADASETPSTLLVR